MFLQTLIIFYTIGDAFIISSLKLVFRKTVYLSYEFYKAIFGLKI